MYILKTSNTKLAAAISLLNDSELSRPTPRHFINALAELQSQFMRICTHKDEPGTEDEFEYIILKLPKDLQVPKPKIR